MRKVVVPWTLNEIRTLRKLSASGMSGRVVWKSMLLPRHTEAAITAKMSELGLGQARYRQRTQNARRNSRERRAEIKAFLWTEGLSVTSYEAALQLGISQNMVMYYRRKLRLRLPDSIRFSSPNFAHTHKHVVAALNRGLVNHRIRFWGDRRDYLLRELAKDADYGAITGLVFCLSCGQKWPANPKYFYLGRRNKLTGEQQLLPHCRACGRSLWGRRLKKTA